MKSDRSIFEATQRPPRDLFYTGHDPVDVKMGQEVSRDPNHYSSADIIILGSPQDEGVGRNMGRRGASAGPDVIRGALYKFPRLSPDLHILDLGNIRIADVLEQTHALQKQVVYQLLKDGKRVVILGGGNDISFPDCAALATLTEDVLAVNIDSHYDVRQDDLTTSGTPYRQLLEGGFLQPRNLYQIAGKDIVNAPVYKNYLVEKGVPIYSLKKLRKIGITKFLHDLLEKKTMEAIFWGFDLDAVRSNDAPGVSAGYPLGLTSEEACEIAAVAGCDPRSRILEISEMNPEYDIDHRTAKLAAMIILHFLDGCNQL